MKTVPFDPLRWLRPFCFLVLASIPINMCFSPIFDFLTVENRGHTWTVTHSTFVFTVSSFPVFIFGTYLVLKSYREKLIFWYVSAFFVYAIIWTVYALNDLAYSLFGLISFLTTTLVAVVFYLAARNELLTSRAVIHLMISASCLAVLPLLLVQIDTIKFAQLSQEFGANNILYGYENPRALGWVSTISLSLVSAHMALQYRSERVSVIFLILAVIASTTLFWSGSRGGLFAFIASFSLLFVFSKTKSYSGLSYVLLCMLAGGLISLLLYSPGGSYGLFSRVNQIVEAASVDAASSGRLTIWQLSIEHILEQPFTGYGYLPQRNLDAFPQGAGSSSAHNIVLDFWLGFGLIIGTAVLLLLNALWGRAFAFFRKANDPSVSALFFVVTTLLFYSLVSGPYARTFPMLILAVSFGTLLGTRSSTINSASGCNKRSP